MESEGIPEGFVNPWLFHFNVWENPLQIKKIIKKKKKNNNTRGLSLPDFKTYYRATVIKTMWYWNEDRYTDQWNSLCINPHKYNQKIFFK